MQANSNEGKVALVTGSTYGIGLAIAKRLVSDGFQVVTNGRTIPKQIVGSHHIRADLTILEEIKELVSELRDKFGKIDVLVCNVGSGRQIDQTSPEARWQHYLCINLFSPVLLIEALMTDALLKKSKIIGISSIASSTITSAPIEYSSAKAALNSYFKNMAFQYASAGNNFNLIALGNVLFPGSTWEEKLKSDKNTVNAFLETKVPAKRFATLDEIADVASFMASTKCDFMTGSTITVDGGQSL